MHIQCIYTHSHCDIVVRDAHLVLQLSTLIPTTLYKYNYTYNPLSASLTIFSTH